MRVLCMCVPCPWLKTITECKHEFYHAEFSEAIQPVFMFLPSIETALDVDLPKWNDILITQLPTGTNCT